MPYPLGGTVTMIRQLTILILLLVLPHRLAVSEDDPRWTTTRSLRDGSLVVMHWVGVYEGRATVYKLAFPAADSEPREIELLGQPVFDAEDRFVALPYCADDGCVAE